MGCLLEMLDIPHCLSYLRQLVIPQQMKKQGSLRVFLFFVIIIFLLLFKNSCLIVLWFLMIYFFSLSYNIIHKRTRIIVERTFGIWKRRFPCLSKGLTTKLSTSTTIVVACAVLHNLSLMFNDKLDDDDEELEDINNEVPEIQPHWQPGDGFLVRNALIERLFR